MVGWVFYLKLELNALKSADDTIAFQIIDSILALRLFHEVQQATTKQTVNVCDLVDRLVWLSNHCSGYCRLLRYQLHLN